MQFSKLLSLDQIAISGAQLDGRCTGRTTARALGYIASAMKEPGITVVVKDHYDSPHADRSCFDKTIGIVHALGLKHFEFNHRLHAITYKIWRD